MTTNTSTNGDEVLRRYLLGTLPQESHGECGTAVLLERRILWEHLSLVEEQLVDDYVWDRLGGDDRERLRHHFLTTDERRAKLEFARALRAHWSGRKKRQTGSGSGCVVPSRRRVGRWPWPPCSSWLCCPA